MPEQVRSILALDAGQKRIGLAIASEAAKLPRVLTTLTNDERLIDSLREIAARENVGWLVVGWPRSLSGNSTEQTRLVEDLADRLRRELKLPLYLQDEALTSVKAEAELKKRRLDYAPDEVDRLAALYILEDFLAHEPKL